MSKRPRGLAFFLLFGVCFFLVIPARSDDESGPRPLRTVSPTDLKQLFPSGTHPLLTRAAMESFLAALEGTPPDWATVYGRGHHDPDHDERLFKLNRERDAGREGNPVREWRVAFMWTGAITHVDVETQSYAVAVGPELTSTSWGIVRFKPEEFPSNLRVRPDKRLAARIEKSLQRHESIPVSVIMVGTLIPNESVIYDFSHEDEGVGLIMPVVRVEQVEVVFVTPNAK